MGIFPPPSFSSFSNSDDGSDDDNDDDRNYELLLACYVLYYMLKNILLDYMRQKLICPDFINGIPKTRASCYLLEIMGLICDGIGTQH